MACLHHVSTSNFLFGERSNGWLLMQLAKILLEKNDDYVIGLYTIDLVALTTNGQIGTIRRGALNLLSV